MNSHLWFNGPSWLLEGTTVTHSFEEDSIPEECIAEMKHCVKKCVCACSKHYVNMM